MKIPSLAVAVAVALALGACGDPAPPALEIGPIGYSAEEIAALDDSATESLADITALTLAIRDDAIVELGEPFVRAAEDSAVLAALPYHVAARAEGLNDQELRAAYRADPEHILTVRHVVRLAPPEETDARRAEQLRVAAEVRQRALAGEDFGALAGAFSEEPGAAERGGLLEPGRRGTWVEPFWEAALALEEGEVSPVVETPYGFHVIRLEQRDTVDFGNANLTRVLRRLISPAQARAAMESWAAAQPLVEGDTPAERDIRWATIAREELGVEPAREATADAEGMWRANVRFWTEKLGLRQEMTNEQIRATALRGATVGGQDALITRSELEQIRPQLRALYP